MQKNSGALLFIYTVCRMSLLFYSYIWPPTICHDFTFTALHKRNVITVVSWWLHIFTFQYLTYIKLTLDNTIKNSNFSITWLQFTAQFIVFLLYYLLRSVHALLSSSWLMCARDIACLVLVLRYFTTFPVRVDGLCSSTPLSSSTGFMSRMWGQMFTPLWLFRIGRI